jgi:hypothetical protein
MLSIGRGLVKWNCWTNQVTISRILGLWARLWFGKRPGDHHLVKGVSVVNETLICVIVFFLAAACSHSQSSLHPLTTRRDCCADFLSLSLLTIVDIPLIQSFWQSF